MSKVVTVSFRAEEEKAFNKAFRQSGMETQGRFIKSIVMAYVEKHVVSPNKRVKGSSFLAQVGHQNAILKDAVRDAWRKVARKAKVDRHRAYYIEEIWYLLMGTMEGCPRGAARDAMIEQLKYQHWTFDGNRSTLKGTPPSIHGGPMYHDEINRYLSDYDSRSEADHPALSAVDLYQRVFPGSAMGSVWAEIAVQQFARALVERGWTAYPDDTYVPPEQ